MMSGQAGEIVCDVLIADAEQSEQILKIASETTDKMRESAGNLRDLSQEERREAFTKLREEFAKNLKEGLVAVLSEEELEAIEPVLGNLNVRPQANVRALRLIELKEGQREELSKVVLVLVEEITPDSPRVRGQQPSDERRAKMREARATFVAKVKEILDAGQVTAWEAKAEEIQEEMSQRRGRQGRDGQGRGGRGQRQG